MRYQLDPTRNVTYVQVALAGDKSADLTITLMGLLPLTAANFALTVGSVLSRSGGRGALETYSKVQTSGASLEYSAFEHRREGLYVVRVVLGPGYANLAANELNLSSTADELLLYDANQTVTERRRQSKLLQTGTGQDPLGYRPVETIDATTSGVRTFHLRCGLRR